MGAKGFITEIERQFNAAISDRVEELRVKHKVHRRDLAQVAGVTQQMFHAYESGITRWPVYRLRLIAAFFDVDVKELMPEVKKYVVIPALQRKLL